MHLFENMTFPQERYFSLSCFLKKAKINTPKEREDKKSVMLRWKCLNKN